MLLQSLDFIIIQWQCETVKRGYDCYEKAAEVRTATGDKLLDHIIVSGTNGKMLSFREEKMLNVTGRMDWER